MVVDDDPDIRDALGDVLVEEGYEVVSRANGRDALDYLKDGAPPRVILLDLMMPVMDGWQFRRRQEADPSLSKIPVIAITAAWGDGHQSGILADHVLPKPLELETLLGLVERYR